MVMWRQPAILAPLRIFIGPYFLRIAIKPGISFSAISISARPHAASSIFAEIKFFLRFEIFESLIFAEIKFF